MSTSLQHAALAQSMDKEPTGAIQLPPDPIPLLSCSLVFAEEHEKLKKAHREAQSKEQVMLSRIAELERLLSVITPDETVQLDSTYGMRVRISTSGLGDSLGSTPTSPLRLGPDLPGAPTAEALGGSSGLMLEAPRVSTTATYTDDSRRLPARADLSLTATTNSNGVLSHVGASGSGGSGLASGDGSNGAAARTGTPGRRRNLSVVPEEAYGSGSPTGQEGGAAGKTFSMRSVGDGQEQTGVARTDRGAK